jgi:hypothetical protein
MKRFCLPLVAFFVCLASAAQPKNVKISFENDSKDTFHLALIIYLSAGNGQTRVSNLPPGETKSYTFTEGAEVFIANKKQEAFAMKGNDVKGSGLKPLLVLTAADNNRVIKLSTFPTTQNNTAQKPHANDALGTWVIDLRPTPESEPYLKDFKFTKIDGKSFNGEFYGYPFEGGFLNTDWDKIYFAFTTADQSGTYFHSGYIEGNKVYGMSLNENRKLMLPWRGERKK